MSQKKSAHLGNTAPHKSEGAWADARQKWVSEPFDGKPRFQKGTQAKHNQQWKLIARGKAVFIMDGICEGLPSRVN